MGRWAFNDALYSEESVLYTRTVFGKRVRRAAAVCGLLLLVANVSVAQIDQRPTELMILTEEAEEAFFDGHYKESVRLTSKAREWLADISNRELMVRRGIDYGVYEGFNHLLAAQAKLHMDDEGGYRYEVGQARQQLTDRRTYYMQRGVDATGFWLCEAFLEFTEGDRYRPTRTHLTVSADGRVKPPFEFLLTDAAKKSLDLDKLLSIASSPRAEQHYDNAGGILEELLHVRFGQSQGGWDPVASRAHSLFIRLLTSRAYTALARQEGGDEGAAAGAWIRDAQAYLNRARELQSEDEVWDTLVPQGRNFPIPYALFETQGAAFTQAGQAGGQGGQQSSPVSGGGRSSGSASMSSEAGGGTGQREVRLTEKDRVMLKGLWARAVYDWVQLELLAAELEARAEEAGFGASGDIRDGNAAEYRIKRIAGMLATQFRNGHPMLLTAGLSLAGWQLTRLNESPVVKAASVVEELPGGEDAFSEEELAGCVVKTRDSIATVRGLYTSGYSPSRTQEIEMTFIELRLLEVLFLLDKKYGVLADGQRQEIGAEARRLYQQLARLSRG